jgi:glycosyltransferase involved in cell wall biosynthesis
MPAVSIVMAAHNEERTIAKAIGSVQNQSLSDWELLVVNDGSTDRTQQVIDQLASNDRRIISIKNSRNLALPSSLNVGIRRARAEFIARADADDLNLCDRLKLQYEFMRHNPNIDVLGSAAWLLDSTGARVRVAGLPLTHSELCSVTLSGTHFFHSSVMIRRRFFEKSGLYDEQFVRAEDKELWYRGLRAGCRYANLPEPLIEYSTNDYKRSWKTIFSRVRSLSEIGAKYGVNRRHSEVAKALLYSSVVKIGLYKPLKKGR